MDLANVAWEEMKTNLQRATLPGGMEVAVWPRPGFHRKYAAFGTHFGAIDREFRTAGGERIRVPAGIAHFLEHEMFEKPDRPVMDVFSALGADPNAYTGTAYTIYLFSTVDNFDEALTTLLGYVQHGVFTAESVAKQKGIIEQEIRMYLDHPSFMVYANLLQAMYRHHPIRDYVAGTVESIQGVTPDLLSACHSTFYDPRRMILCVVGDVDPARVVELAEGAVRVPAGPPPVVERFYPDEPAGVVEARVTREMLVSRPYAFVGFKGPQVDPRGPEGLRREIMASFGLQVLFGEATSWYQELYQDGTITEGFGAGYEQYPRASFVLVGGQSEHPERLVERVYRRVEDAHRQGLDPAGFERVRRQMLGNVPAMLDQPESLAHEYITYRFLDWDLMSVPAVIRTLDMEEVLAFVKTNLSLEATAVSTVTPPEGTGAAPVGGGV